MKKKILFMAVAIAVTAISYATEPVAGDCDRPACGGGPLKCCTDTNGNTFYTSESPSES